MNKFIEAFESIWVTATFAEHGMHINDCPAGSTEHPATERAWSA